MAAYFSLEEIQELEQYGSRILRRVDYIFWVNNTLEEPLYLIDSIILGFDQDLALELVLDDPGTGIALGGKDYEVEQMKLEEEYNGKIFYKKLPADKLRAWGGTIGQPLLNIDLITEDKKNFKNEGLVLNFNTGKVGITALDDELKAVPLEDDDEA